MGQKTPQFFWKENKMDWICPHTQDASNKIKVYFEIPEPKRCSVSRHPSSDWHRVWAVTTVLSIKYPTAYPEAVSVNHFCCTWAIEKKKHRNRKKSSQKKFLRNIAELYYGVKDALTLTAPFCKWLWSGKIGCLST